MSRQQRIVRAVIRETNSRRQIAGKLLAVTGGLDRRIVKLRRRAALALLAFLAMRSRPAPYSALVSPPRTEGITRRDARRLCQMLCQEIYEESDSCWYELPFGPDRF